MSDITLHVELMGQDRDLLERVCENLEWYRKHLQEQAQLMRAEQEQARKRWEGETKEKLPQPLSAEDRALLMQVEQEEQKARKKATSR